LGGKQNIFTVGNKIYLRRETKYIYGGKQNILQAADGRWGSFGGEKARLTGLHFNGARVVDGQAVVREPVAHGGARGGVAERGARGGTVVEKTQRHLQLPVSLRRS
jgi:hypothetical protein